MMVADNSRVTIYGQWIDRDHPYANPVVCSTQYSSLSLVQCCCCCTDHRHHSFVTTSESNVVRNTNSHHPNTDHHSKWVWFRRAGSISSIWISILVSAAAAACGCSSWHSLVPSSGSLKLFLLQLLLLQLLPSPFCFFYFFVSTKIALLPTKNWICGTSRIGSATETDPKDAFTCC